MRAADRRIRHLAWGLALTVSLSAFLLAVLEERGGDGGPPPAEADREDDPDIEDGLLAPGGQDGNETALPICPEPAADVPPC